MSEHHTPPWAPGTGTARGAVVTGITGCVTEVRARISNGPDAFTIRGLRDGSADTTRDRIRAAVLSSSLPWPGRSIGVSILPGGLPGCGLDLPIAIAVLIAAGAISAEAAGRCVMLAELGLDGGLRPVRGVLPALTAAGQAGYRIAVLAPDDAGQTALAPGISAVPCGSLRAVLTWLGIWRLPPPRPWYQATGHQPMQREAGLLAAAPQVLLALQAAAAGGHHVCLTGPPGLVSSLAAGIKLLLPSLDLGQSAEVAALCSAAGLRSAGLGPGFHIPPWRSPHYSASLAAMIGGGTGIARPGETALAHHGVLFLERAPEFSLQVLTALRTPLTHGEVAISRSGQITRFPARFTLIAGLPPCSCPASAERGCTPAQIRRYHHRVTCTLAGHLSMRVTAAGGESGGDPDPRLWAAHVADARERAGTRLAGTPWQRNADMPAAELARSFHPGTEAAAGIARAADVGQVGYRGAAQVTRLAWTLADLAGRALPGRDQCEQALALYLGTST